LVAHLSQSASVAQRTGHKPPIARRIATSSRHLVFFSSVSLSLLSRSRLHPNPWSYFRRPLQRLWTRHGAQAPTRS